MTDEPVKQQDPESLAAALPPGAAASPWAEPWREAVRMAWAIARGRRRAELERKRAAAFDSRGLHSFSVECGRILFIEDLEPEFALAGFDPRRFVQQAERQAQDEWITEQLEARDA